MSRMVETEGEVVIQGIGVSPGVAVGPVFLMTTEEEAVLERDILPRDIPQEISRFEQAVIETRHQLAEIHRTMKNTVGPLSANIFEVHMMVLDDSAFVEEVIRQVGQYHKNCEIIVQQVSSRYSEALQNVGDDYLRERVVDVKDVTRRIMRNISGQYDCALSNLKEPHLVVSMDLSPSDTAAMRKDQVLGFVTDQGSATSHTAIMARALEIPAVVGLGDISTKVRRGMPLLIDGTRGVVVINPSHDRLAEFDKIQAVRNGLQKRLKLLRDEPAQTLDGHRVIVSANIELAEEAGEVCNYGAEGVGLYRSEYLFVSRRQVPSEDEQFAAYNVVAEQLMPQKVIIRTFDLGGDKILPHLHGAEERNPFLGFRAIRFCLAHPDIFKNQLRAILRASARRNVAIMYPMISSVSEVIRANALLAEAKNDLLRQGVPYDENIEVGAMIEIPSAALTADILADHVDFFSLGTNDLVQYTIAVDRVNERVASLYEPTHPAVLKLIELTIRAGHRKNLWVGVCGEMAGDPVLAPLLLGLGVDEYSMVPSSVPLVKAVLRNITMVQARDLAAAALAAESAVDVLTLCYTLVRSSAPEILELVPRMS